MTISSVSTSCSVYSGSYDGISPIEENVFYKLRLRAEKNEKYFNEVCQAVKECVVPHLGHFSKNGASLIMRGRAPAVPLFMIVASYLGGEKINDQLPEFVADLFNDKEKREIEHDRKLIRWGQASSFLLKDGVERTLESFYAWSRLNTRSSTEQISAVFLRSDLRPIESQTTFERDIPK